MTHPLTHDDVSNVLIVATAFDNRKPSPVMLAAWTDALNIAGPFPVGDAIEGVKRHYAESTDYLMPAHVTAFCRERHRERRAALPEVETFMSDVDNDDPNWLAIRRARERDMLDEMVRTGCLAIGGAE